jgi:hypothetical protein
MQVSASIYKVDASGRDVGEISVLRGGLVGCDESGEQYCQMQRQKKDCGGDESFLAVLFAGFHA